MLLCGGLKAVTQYVAQCAYEGYIKTEINIMKKQALHILWNLGYILSLTIFQHKYINSSKTTKVKRKFPLIFSADWIL